MDELLVQTVFEVCLAPAHLLNPPGTDEQDGASRRLPHHPLLGGLRSQELLENLAVFKGQEAQASDFYGLRANVAEALMHSNSRPGQPGALCSGPVI